MILTECAIFASLFVAGMLAGLISLFLLVLGKASRAARAVCDFLVPLSSGTTYFFFLLLFSSGTFRFYSLLAFLLGYLVEWRLSRRLSPLFRRLANKAILPIKSLNDALEARVEKMLRPIREKLAKRRKNIREKRAAKRQEKTKKKEILLREKAQKTRGKQKKESASSRKKKGESRPNGRKSKKRLKRAQRTAFDQSD